MEDIIKAHEYSIRNFETLKKDKLCGCFYCKKTFDSSEIYDWTIEPDGTKTALCPYCNIDSVIGEGSGFSMTPEFLERMRKYWF